MQWMMAHPWMTLFLAVLAICIADNMVVNVCRVVAFLAERREAGKRPEKSGGVVWHDAKTDPPPMPGVYYGKQDDTNSMQSVMYRDGKWTFEAYPTTEVNVLQWAEMTDFVEVGNDD